MKKLLPLFIVVFLLFAFALPIRAASLKLNKIGTDITEDKTFSEWTYEGTNPAFVGEASASATVEVKVDDLTDEVIADINGNWSWQPTAMDEADYNITIKSGGEFIYFTLHLTEETTGDATPSGTPTVTPTTGKGGVTEPDELLDSGSFETTVLLVAGGMTLLGLGVVMKEKFSDQL